MTESERPPIATAADHQLAARLAEEAGQLLIDLRADMATAPASSLKAEGDRRSHEFLVSRLAELAPGDAVLSEEGIDKADRLKADRVWIIDPLDGTREFGEPPREDWAVHVALVAGHHPIAGAVSIPARAVVHSTARPPAPVQRPRKPRVIVSRSRPPRIALAIASALEAELVEMGSAGAKVAAVIEGLADIYPHAGGQYEWDNCAPVAVAAAAGLHCSRIDGGDLVYNQPDVWLPDLLVCPPEYVGPILEITRT